MNDKYLKSFITIAENGSFSKAENILFISKQALKKQIDTLEEEVGMQLLLRSSRGVVLTESGKKFLEGARRILSVTSQEIERSRKKSAQEILKIAVLPDMMDPVIANVIPEFCRLFPQYRIEYVPMSNTEWLDALEDGRVSICLCPDKYLALKLKHDLSFSLINDQPVYCLMNYHNPLAKRRLIKLSDLQNCHVYIGLKIWYSEILKEIREKQENITVIESIYTHNEIVTICLDGGIWILGRERVEHFQPLISVPLDIKASFRYGLAYKKNPSGAVKNFIRTSARIYNKE